jgi:hypothetical protein
MLLAPFQPGGGGSSLLQGAGVWAIAAGEETEFQK